jgi:hypothetical protein
MKVNREVKANLDKMEIKIMKNRKKPQRISKIKKEKKIWEHKFNILNLRLLLLVFCYFCTKIKKLSQKSTELGLIPNSLKSHRNNGSS